MENTIYVACGVVLEETTLDDSNAAVLIKTHTFRGEKTKEFWCRLRSSFSTENINANMFKAYNINIVLPSSNRVIASSKTGTIPQEFYNFFVKCYQSKSSLKSIDILMNSNFEVIYTDNKISFKRPVQHYSKKEVADMFQSLSKFLLERNNLKSKNALKHSQFDPFLKNTLEGWIASNFGNINED